MLNYLTGYTIYKLITIDVSKNVKLLSLKPPLKWTANELNNKLFIPRAYQISFRQFNISIDISPKKKPTNYISPSIIGERVI